jgi:hypothetical protein
LRLASGQQAPEEEAQVAAVSGYLSFVPFQIVKWEFGRLGDSKIVSFPYGFTKFPPIH